MQQRRPCEASTPDLVCGSAHARKTYAYINGIGVRWGWGPACSACVRAWVLGGMLHVWFHVGWQVEICFLFLCECIARVGLVFGVRVVRVRVEECVNRRTRILSSFCNFLMRVRVFVCFCVRVCFVCECARVSLRRLFFLFFPLSHFSVFFFFCI